MYYLKTRQSNHNIHCGDSYEVVFHNWSGQNGHLGQAIIQVPQIPQSFIESYCKKPVDKVMVEYDYYADGKISILDRIMIPKLTSNNEIIIHHIEEKMYSETELIQFVLDNRFRID